MKKQTDEKGNPLTYWGGLEEPKQEPKKQTAVEWLTEKLKIEFGLVFSNNILDEAKEMEKQQIIDAHIKGYIAPLSTIKNWDAEQYYNETYNNETTKNH
jgi:hypothetical protein